jgi:beta-ribofuranosylaminobenzene 5'-phosphate synthase
MVESVNIKDISYKSRVIFDGSVASMVVFPRVHMFSIDLSEDTLSGGMGFSVPVIPITITAEEAVGHDYVETEIAETEIKEVLVGIRKMTGILKFWKISVSSNVVRSHIGLGSTTQIVGAAIMTATTVGGIKLSLDQIVKLGVGQVSGVGISLLFNPGFVLELGYATSQHPYAYSFKHPAIKGLYAYYKGAILDINPPTDWGVILAIPKTGQSLSDQIESNFWAKILPTDKHASHQISFNVLMGLMPALISGDFDAFLDSLREIVSNGTKPDETAIQGVVAKRVLANLKLEYGFSSVSSLGPTLYSIIKNKPSNAELSKLRKMNPEYSFYCFSLSSCWEVSHKPLISTVLQ